MKNILTVLCAGAILTAGAWAQDPTPQTPPPAKKEGRIQARKERQQGRIAQGVKSGQLTAGETAKLEKKESNLNKEIRQERKANGGNLTNNEKKQVNRQQNRLSKQIYNKKHNAATQPK